MIRIPLGEIVVGTGPAGPAGPAGPTGGTATVTAGENISALRVLRGHADGKYRLCRLQNDDFGTAICLSITAATADNPINVIYFGTHTDALWTWSVNTPIFLGANGSLTQTPSNTIYNQIVAIPISETVIKINIHQPVRV